jgi:hypothetical protein
MHRMDNLKPDTPEIRILIDLNPVGQDPLHKPARQRGQNETGLKSRNGMSDDREEKCEQESADPARGIDELLRMVPFFVAMEILSGGCALFVRIIRLEWFSSPLERFPPFYAHFEWNSTRKIGGRRPLAGGWRIVPRHAVLEAGGKGEREGTKAKGIEHGA